MEQNELRELELQERDEEREERNRHLPDAFLPGEGAVRFLSMGQVVLPENQGHDHADTDTEDER